MMSRGARWRGRAFDLLARLVLLVLVVGVRSAFATGKDGAATRCQAPVSASNNRIVVDASPR